jgi:hypothetical protein
MLVYHLRVISSRSFIPTFLPLSNYIYCQVLSCLRPCWPCDVSFKNETCRLILVLRDKLTCIRLWLHQPIRPGSLRVAMMFVDSESPIPRSDLNGQFRCLVFLNKQKDLIQRREATHSEDVENAHETSFGACTTSDPQTY